MVEVLAKSYGEGFVKAAEALDAKPQVTKDDSKILREDVARLTKPIQDYNKALAGKIDQIVRDSFAAGKDDLEVGRILRARIPEILNNEPITIQRPGKRPVSFTADEYADIVANVVPYAVRNEGYIRGLKEAGADGWQSVAVGDERMCPMCGEKHGQVYGWEDPKPPYHPKCRCRPVAYFRPRTKEDKAESERIKAKALEKQWESSRKTFTPSGTISDAEANIRLDIGQDGIVWEKPEYNKPTTDSDKLKVLNDLEAALHDVKVAYPNADLSNIRKVTFWERNSGRAEELTTDSDGKILTWELKLPATPIKTIAKTKSDALLMVGSKAEDWGVWDKDYKDIIEVIEKKFAAPTSAKNGKELMIHEMGHILVDPKIGDWRKLRKNYDKWVIESDDIFSVYGAASPEEGLAEAFVEAVRGTYKPGMLPDELEKPFLKALEGMAAETQESIAEALIDDIIPAKMAYPGSTIERPKLERKVIGIDESEVVDKYVTKYMSGDPSVFSKIDNQDMFLSDIVKSNEFDGLPKLVSPDELDKIVAEGHRELWRGVSQKDFADKFKSGEYFAGTGIYGDGTYTAYGPRQIDIVSGYAGSEDGCIIRMAIDKDAKIITIDDLKREMSDYLNELSAESAKKLSAIPKGDKDLYLRFSAENSVKMIVANDPGKFAALKGYDAIDIPSENYMVVINRKALYVHKESISIEQLNALKSIERIESNISDMNKRIKELELDKSTKATTKIEVLKDMQSDSRKEISELRKKLW